MKFKMGWHKIYSDIDLETIGGGWMICHFLIIQVHFVF